MQTEIGPKIRIPKRHRRKEWVDLELYLRDIELGGVHYCVCRDRGERGSKIK